MGLREKQVSLLPKVCYTGLGRSPTHLALNITSFTVTAVMENEMRKPLSVPCVPELLGTHHDALVKV